MHTWEVEVCLRKHSEVFTVEADNEEEAKEEALQRAFENLETGHVALVGSDDTPTPKANKQRKEES